MFSKDLLKDKIKKLSTGLKAIKINELLDSVCKGLYEGMHLKEIDYLVVKEVENKMEEHYEYSYLASRFILDDLYKEILGRGFSDEDISKLYQERFKEYIHFGIEEELLTSEFKTFNIKKISESIDFSRDKLFKYLGIQTLCDRYLLKNRNKDTKLKRIFELPQWMWMRVAMGLAVKEVEKEEKAIEFYNIISNLFLVPSTPTLFNSGTTYTQLSSCYINTVEDSLKGILKIFPIMLNYLNGRRNRNRLDSCKSYRCRN